MKNTERTLAEQVAAAAGRGVKAVLLSRWWIRIYSCRCGNRDVPFAGFARPSIEAEPFSGPRPGVNIMLDIDGFLNSAEFLTRLAALISTILSVLAEQLFLGWFTV